MSDKQDAPSILESDCLETMDPFYAYLNGELDDSPESAGPGGAMSTPA